MARIRKDVQQRQKVAEDYGNKVWRFPDEAQSYDALRKEYMHLADIADRRMRRLEEYAGKEPAYANILKFAYDKAIWDIQAVRGEGAYRFAGGVPKTGNTLKMQSRINDVLKFLNSPTSTISGIKKVYGARAKTINEKYGMDLTWENMADFFENDLLDRNLLTDGVDTTDNLRGRVIGSNPDMFPAFSFLYLLSFHQLQPVLSLSSVQVG